MQKKKSNLYLELHIFVERESQKLVSDEDHSIHTVKQWNLKKKKKFTFSCCQKLQLMPCGEWNSLGTETKQFLSLLNLTINEQLAAIYRIDLAACHRRVSYEKSPYECLKLTV